MTAHEAQPRTVSTGHRAFVTTLYAMATARLVSADLASLKREDEKALEAVKTPEDSGTLAFFQRAQLASAAAWSPKEPPLYLDLPVKDGAAQPDVLAKWAANAPLAFMDQYIGGLRPSPSMLAIRTVCAPMPPSCTTLSYGTANSFEVYQGTHTSKGADRFRA